MGLGALLVGLVVLVSIGPLREPRPGQAEADSLGSIREPTLVAFGPDRPEHLDEARRIAARLGFAFRQVPEAPRYLPFMYAGNLYRGTVYVPPGVTGGYIVATPGGDISFLSGSTRARGLYWYLRWQRLPSSLRRWVWDVPTAIGVLLLLIAAQSRVVDHRWRFWILTTVVAFAGGAVELSMAARVVPDPRANLLGRDVFFAVLWTGLVIAHVGALSGYLARRKSRRWLRFLLPLASTVALLLMGPMLSLMVHCTSGDCL